MERELLKGHLDMLILAVIARSPGHGYAILQDLRELSDGAFDLAEGTIYPALHRLEQKGLLTSLWKKVENRQRRTYEITIAGNRVLNEHKKTWSDMQRNIKQVLGAAT